MQQFDATKLRETSLPTNIRLALPSSSYHCRMFWMDCVLTHRSTRSTCSKQENKSSPLICKQVCLSCSSCCPFHNTLYTEFRLPILCVHHIPSSILRRGPGAEIIDSFFLFISFYTHLPLSSYMRETGALESTLALLREM